MAKPMLVVHPTCASSYSLVKGLKKLGILDRVELVVADKPLPRLVWSVPWIEVEGEPVATDPVTLEEVLEILENKWRRRIEPLQAFTEALLHSSYASSLAALWSTLDPVLDKSFIAAAVRAKLSHINVELVVSKLRGQRLSKELGEKIGRALAVSFVRDLWWATGGALTPKELSEIVSRESVATWIIARASLGRIGLPSQPSPDKQVVNTIITFVRKAGKGLLSKIEREQKMIIDDREYWDILGISSRA